MASPVKPQQPTAGSGAPKSSTRESSKSEGKSSSAARSSKAPAPALHHHHPYGHHPLMMGGAGGAGGKVASKLASAAGVDSLSALHLLPAHLRDMVLAAHLLRGYYQPAGPLISPHLLPQPPPVSQHGGGPLGGSKSSGPESESPLQGPQQPPASTTADSTDSDVLLTGTSGAPAPHHHIPSDAYHPFRPADADRCFRSIFAGGDLAPRAPGPYGGHHRYGPAAGPPPAANLYPRPLQMHCPPTYLPANYYASPYGQPPPPPPPPHDMYYAHAYPPHYYPKFPPQYYPTRRQYYPGPPGPPGPEHLYEQPPPSSAPVAPPPPPPAGAQLVPAGPQGPQHLDHYPYAYPGYGSPGPGSGGQCYTRNLQHPPPYLDAHYTTNCPCPMQCPKNVNAGSLIGIKASKGPVATNNNTNKNNHIVQSQTSTAGGTISTAEPLSSSSYPVSSSSSASPAPIDLHASISSPMAETVSKATPAATQAPLQHTYPHHHQPLQRPPLVEHHPAAPPHHTHPYHLHHPRHGGGLPPAMVVTTAPEVTPTAAPHSAKASVSSVSGPEMSLQHPVMTTAPTNGGGGGVRDNLDPAQMCYKAEQLIKPETAPTNLMPDPMHYGDPYLHHYHHSLGYYHHPKLSDLKDDLHGQLAPAPPPGSQYTIARLEPIDLHVSPPRGPATLSEKAMQPASLIELEANGKDGLHGSLLSPTTVVKREIEDFKLDPLAGDAGVATLKGKAVCKKEDFEERGPAMTPDLLPLLDDRPIVIKKDCDDEKAEPVTCVGGVSAAVAEGTFHQPAQHLHHHMLHHHPHHHVHLASHHHHSASTNLLHQPRHHHLHPQHYGGSMQLVQQPPAPAAAATLRLEQDTEMADTKLPIAARDCKSDLAELVLTTESSMASGVPPSPAATTSTTSTITVSHHSRDISSDSSISFSDSVNPSTDGDLASPEPGAFPASTVKRRALLVACKKSTTKQSPPNSYKNLIKRTNGDHHPPDEEGELRQDESLAPVELSDDEEEEEDEEEEDEEEDDEEEEEDEQDDEEEDVEKVEMVEQARQADRMRAKKGRLASKIAICKRNAKMVVPGGRWKCPSSTSLSSGSASNGSRKLLLLTQQPHHSRWGFKNPSPPASRRLVKRVHRVFRTSIESLRKLPPRLGGGLVPTARRQRFVRKLRLSKSPARSVSNESSDPQTSSSVESAIEGSVYPLTTFVTDLDQGQLPAAVNSPFGCSPPPEPAVDAVKDPITTEPVKPPLSNVDRTIDLVARGYFSEPEILVTDLQKNAYSRAWLKKVKQQQQQEGRSHSEQSREAKRDRDRSSDSAGGKSACKKKTKKATTPSTDNCTVVEKKSKSKTKTSKSAGDSLPHETDQVQPDASQRKTKNKSSRKESKKESKKAKKKKKLKDGADDGRKKEQPVVEQPIAMEVELDSAYQRATSTPIRTDAVDCMEVDDHHGAGPCDESVAGCPLDQSSVIDDRETDFDDAATMLVEDDVASVDTSVLITRHNNNNNISTITDKNNPADEQMVVPAHPLQAIIADGKEGSELEPPEGMEPFLDDPMEDPDDVLQLQVGVTHQQQQISLPPPPPTTQTQPQMSPDDRPIPMQTDYIDDYEYYDEDDELPPKRATSRTIKRKRTRPKPSKKFSTKKRHRRPSAHRYEVEEIIVPRRCTNIPRWSNGWTWEGQPFQGKVFLNSDDAPVLRTCYPAMRHSEGDIIRPRDCVLLRAGNKRSELPYVAKVAYLWENPEDGEMMMSLLWYYRPEHTEQGRQRADGPDEVFASRHKDHNSVACIEDKCYVLTFSEYCRFRRQMKGFEENVEEQPSIVPPPVQRRENPRLPPPVVSPELVMYCQRVYEFRLKRLLKTTS
ncbi:uncharacterized protein LOC131207197 [Anopheles bellator]|uniref:uncharacterized protein LOC131207197 n=1 Tax=Anopheles bellator TaxID=139047 RepID=UPI002649C5A7|nr:uncharacterized protein LOC131207197 [Anopheles bellator]